MSSWIRNLFARGVALSLLGTAAMVTVGVESASAAPAIGIRFRLIADGTPSWEGPDGPGNDTAADNGITRNQDTVSLRWGVNVNGEAATSASIVQTLPVGMVWDLGSAPSGCDPATFSNNNRTITCDLGAIPSGSAFDLTATARVSGSNPHGTVLTMPSPVFRATGATGTATAALEPSLQTISSGRPKLDLRKDRAPWQQQYAAGPAGEPGVVASYPISLEVVGGGKGSEALNPSQDIKIIDTFTSYLAGTGTSAVASGTPNPLQNGRLYTWGSRTGSPGGTVDTWELGSANPVDGCYWNGEGAVAQGVHFYWDMPYGKAGSVYTNYPSQGFDPKRSVGDSGTWSCTQATPGAPINLTISGADTTGDQRPTLAGYPFYDYSLPTDTTFIATGIIQVWFPISDFPTTGASAYQLDVRNRVVFDPASPPRGISGQVNIEPHNVAPAPGQNAGPNPGDTWYNTNDNNRIHTLVGVQGSFDKGYLAGEVTNGYAGSGEGWWYLVPGQSAWRAGDGYVGPGQDFSSRASFTNEGFLDRTVTLCDYFDNSWQSVRPFTGEAAIGSTGTGTQAAFLSSLYYFGRVVPAADIVQLPQYSANASLDLETLRSSNCGDSFGPWYNNINDVPGGAAAVTRVRATMVVKPGEIGTLRVSLKAKNTAPDDALLVNFGSFTDSYSGGYYVPNYTPGGVGAGTGIAGNPWNTLGYVSDPTLPLPVGYGGDRLRVARATARITKKTVNPTADPALPADDSVGAVRAGKPVTYELAPSFNSYLPVPPVAEHFYIYDILDKSVTYVTGSSVANPATPAVAQPTVTASVDPVSGDAITVLRWDLGVRTPNNPLPKIRYTVRTKATVPGGTVSGNSVIVDAVDSLGASLDGSGCLPAGTWTIGTSHDLDWALPSSSQTVQNADSSCPRGWSRNITINQLSSLAVGKEVVEKNIQVDGTFTYRVTYANTQPTPALTNIDLIDALPEAGDGREPASNFVGTATMVPNSLILAEDNGVETYAFYVTTAPKSQIRSIYETDPANPLPVTTVAWCPIANVGTSGPGCPAGDWSRITGWRFTDSGALDAGENGVVEFKLKTKDNKAGNIYTNRATAKAAEVSLPVASNDVSISVVAGTISNFVWEDLNGNGLQDSGEPPIEGVQVNLLQNDGSTPVQHWTGAGSDGIRGTSDDVYSPYVVNTDVNGLYSFVDLPAGDYKVQFNVSAPYVGTTALTGTNRATDSNAQRLADTYSYGTPTIHLACRDFDNVDRLPTCSPLTLASVDSDPTIDAGFVKPVSIGDKVWLDVDGNGIQGDPAVETPVAGATATLWRDTDGDPATVGWTQVITNIDGGALPNGGTATTGANGLYLFSNLAPGIFQVRFTAPAGYLITQPTAGTDRAVDSDAVSATGTPNQGSSAGLLVPSGTNERRVDAGMYRPVSIGDRVWLDANGDGTQSANTTLEPGIAGAKVTLWRDTDGDSATIGWTQVIADAAGATFGTTGTITTPASGAYLFGNLPPAIYQVRFESTDASLGFTQPNSGTDTTDSDAVASSRTLAATGSYTLLSGANNLTVDAGFTTPASLGNRVWLDVNGDGLQDASTTTEPGVSGATVQLEWLNPATGLWATSFVGIDGLAYTSSQTTPASGAYLFENLVPGDYRIKVTPPAGYFRTVTTGADATLNSDVNQTTGYSSSVTLAGGQQNLNLDAGLFQVPSVGSLVWDDLDADGIQDAGEPGIGGVLVQLIDAATSAVIGSTSTASNGTWAIDRQGTDQADGAALTLLPGSYKVVFTRPSGYRPSPTLNTVADTTANDSDPVFASATATTGTSSAFTLSSGETEPDIDAGFFKPVSVGDLVWQDTNGNGIQDGSATEPPVAGAKVTLYVDTDGNPATVGWTQVTADLDGTTFGTAGTITTPANGTYLFNNLRPGIYEVRFEAPAGMVLTASNVTTATEATDSDAVRNVGNSATGKTGAITLSSGDARTNVDAGVYALASIGNRVWEDSDRDGIQDAGERGVANIPVTLTGTDGAGNPVSLSAITDSFGNYQFSNLAPGSYQVSIMPPLKFQPTLQDRDTDATDSDINPLDLDPGAGQRFSMIATTLTSGESDQTWDAGLITAPIVSGHVYEDLNNDGIRDTSEPGIGGVQIRLTGTDSNGNPVNLTTTTDSLGFYIFPTLNPSDAIGYTLTETHPTAYLDGKDAAGTLGGNATVNDVISTIVVRSSDVSLNNDFGEVKAAKLSGTVYVDATDDGIAQAGETRLSGINVTLTGTDDLGMPVNITVQTNGAGFYEFTGLRPGTYTVTEGATPGYTDGKDTAGTKGGNTTINDAISAIVLTSGDNSRNNNFGERPVAPGPITRVSGTVWLDPNRDGVRQAGENTGIGGVTISLTLPDGTVVATTTTDGNGHYVFDGIAPGNYVIVETQPTDYLSTSPNERGSTGTPIVVPAAGLTNQDFFEALGSLAGHVYVDTIDNGVRDAAEPGIGGVTVRLFDVATNTLVATTTTAADGTYLFNNLKPGEYRIVEAPPAGWVDDLDAAGSLGGIVTNDVLNNIPLLVGERGVNYDFGEQPPVVNPGKTWLSGHVYVDANNSNDLENGEGGLGGIRIELWKGGIKIAETTTDATGSYQFLNIDPGTYTVKETQPAGYTSTEEADNEITDVVVPAAGLPNQDFGERLPDGVAAKTFVSGIVWVDRDGDGIADLGEPGIEGVTITLKDAAGNVVATTLTGPGGAYSFTDIAPGTYTIEETNPAGYANSPGTPATVRSAITVPLEGLGNQNFGELLASVEGFVYEDLNNDGFKDPGEPGIGGVTMTLTGTNDAGDLVSVTAITDASGHYIFSDLRASNGAGYTITETDPVGYADGIDAVGSLGGTGANDVTSAIVVPAGSAGINYNFGEITDPVVTNPGTVWIGGVVYFDSNRDGAINAADEVMVGVKLNLLDAGGLIVGTTITGPDGKYLFTGLTPGASYTIVEDQPVGYGSSQTPTNSIPVTAPATGGTTGYNFGETLSTISGSVYVDADNDGVRDAGEFGISGVTVTLTGTADDGEEITLTTITAADGSYVFNKLKGGNYAVTETHPTAYNDGKDTYAATGIVSLITNDKHAAIELPLGTDAPGYLFGEIAKPAVTTFIEGRVFVDRGTNGMTSNGTYEAGEPSVGGVTIILRDAGGNIIATTTTAADGTYRFDGIAPGTYTVEELQPTGYGSSTPNTLSVDVPLVGRSNVNFGEVLAATFGHVFADMNGNGVQDAGEPGIGGVTITLTGTDDRGNTVVRTTVSNADGTWAITDLPPSNPAGYTLAETPPPGWYDGSDASSRNGVIANDVVASLVLAPGQVAESGNFGEVAPLTVGNFVWDDLNGNGRQDPGEPGIGGVNVTLIGTNDLGQPVSLTTTTAADGSYQFTGLRPGTYTVTFTDPAGYIPTWSGVGSDRGVDSDATGSCRCVTVTLVGNPSLTDTSSNRTDLDAGFVRPGSVTGVIYDDNDKTGNFGPKDTVRPGQTVTIQGAGPDGVFGTSDDPAPIVVVTDASGRYNVPGLIPGNYNVTTKDKPTVSVSVPPGGVGIADFIYPPSGGNGAGVPGSLPRTGNNALDMTLLAGMVLGLGVVLTAASRRRRRPQAA
jgi:protocatechuate 3,4-dioxygenase beta subunit